VRHVPTRTCLGCRQRRPQGDLVRLVRGEDGVVAVDVGGKGAGRGAYVCAEPECTGRALKAGRLAHAFRAACRPSERLESTVLAMGRSTAVAGHDSGS
jgi:uncharacterized protein